MGDEFGTDLEGVNVHEGAGYGDDLSAAAYTSGSDIAFGSDDPGTPDLYAHELTHVVQQGADTGWHEDADAGDAS